MTFAHDSKMKKVEVAGGTPQTLCDVVAARGGTWSRSGVIVFARSNSPLYQVSANGGAVTEATRFDAEHEIIFHYWPQFLPDGRHFYLQRSQQPEHRGIFVGSLDTQDSVKSSPARFAACSLKGTCSSCAMGSSSPNHSTIAR
jgi:hypothetical protein